MENNKKHPQQEAAIPFNISDFAANGLKLDGARPSQFEVSLFPPFASPAAPRSVFLIRAASLPASELGEVQVPYFGRFIKLQGDRTYADWDVTIMNDEDFALRNMLEKWSNLMNSAISNVMDESVFPLGYKANATVKQFGKTGNIVAKYQFQGMWPRVVSPIQLDWSQQNAVEEFQCVFSYDEWVRDYTETTISQDSYSPISGTDGTQN